MNVFYICTHIITSKLFIMNKIEIPKKENKTKRLFVPVTPSEHEAIMKVCNDQKIKLTDLIRFSLKQIINF